MDSRTYAAAEVLWNFLGQPNYNIAGEENLAILCGSRDLFIADHVANLYHAGSLSAIICSGGIAHTTDLLATGWNSSEARVFGDELKRLGVPSDIIYLEEMAKNTAENIALSLELASSEGIKSNNIVFVHKPFMMLRTWLTASNMIPEGRFSVNSPSFTLRDYLSKVDDVERTLSIMVGDFERIISYALKGFLVATDIPATALAAAHFLRKSGYGDHSIIL